MYLLSTYEKQTEKLIVSCSKYIFPNYNGFTISFSVVDSSELMEVLITLGANDLVDSKRAELTGIIKLNDDINNRLSLKNFIYKTRVDITGKNEHIPTTNNTNAINGEGIYFKVAKCHVYFFNI